MNVITKTCPCNIFHGCKNDNFHMKMFNIFLIFAQNIDCGYMLEPPHEFPQSMFWSKNKKKVYPCKPQLYYIKMGCKGVFITRTCLHDVHLLGHECLNMIIDFAIVLKKIFLKYLLRRALLGRYCAELDGRGLN